MKPSRELYLLFFLLLLFLCPIFICVHGSRVFHEYTSFLFIVKDEAVRSAGYKSGNVFIVKFDGVGGVLSFDDSPKFGPNLPRPWWENLM